MSVLAVLTDLCDALDARDAVLLRLDPDGTEAVIALVGSGPIPAPTEMPEQAAGTATSVAHADGVIAMVTAASGSCRLRLILARQAPNFATNDLATIRAVVSAIALSPSGRSKAQC
jgi:hypothetical protein